MQEYGTTSFVEGPISFKSDSVWTYELGEKFRTTDHRMTINAAAYYTKWSNVQQVNPLSSCGYTYTANVGDAEVKGGELEIQAIVVPDLVASVNGSYTDAAMVSTTLINAGFNPGTPIQQIPRWTSSGALSYRHRLTEQLAWSARADYTYTGSRTDVTYATNTLPAYTLANVRGGVEGVRWSTTLFINNVADKRAQLSNIVQTAINLPTFNRVAVSQPRTIGIDVNYRFGR
jgi:outer membrane receptor protein involved in Fe transport